MNIRISWQSGQVTATLEETPTSAKVKAALPFESEASKWGKEIYFEVPFAARLEPNATDVVDPGTVCFWVEGKSLAIPYGPTPVSKGDECRLISRVNILGRIQGDTAILDSIKDGDPLKVEEA